MSLHGSSHSYPTPPCTSVSGPSCTEARSACSPTEYQLLTDVYTEVYNPLIYINMYVCLLYIQGERERETGSLFRVSMHFQPTNEFCGMLGLYSSKERMRKAGVLLNAGACPQFLWETSIQFYSVFSL